MHLIITEESSQIEIFFIHFFYSRYLVYYFKAIRLKVNMCKNMLEFLFSMKFLAVSGC